MAVRKSQVVFVLGVLMALSSGLAQAYTVGQASAPDGTEIMTHRKNAAGWFIGPTGTLTCRVFVRKGTDSQKQVVVEREDTGREILRSRCIDNHWADNCDRVKALCQLAEKLGPATAVSGSSPLAD